MSSLRNFYSLLWNALLYGLANLLLAITAAADLPVFNEAAVQAWWKALPADADFVKEGQAWQEKLREAQDTSGVERIGAMPNFLGWLEMAGWLELAGAQPG